MRERPTCFDLYESDAYNMLSSWRSYVHVRREPGGELVVWSYVESEHGRQDRAEVGKIRTVEQLLKAVTHCCSMVEFDDGVLALRDNLDQLYEMAPDLAEKVEDWFDAQDIEEDD